MRVVSIPDSGECFDLDRPGAVAAWNRALNRRYAMENLRRHPNGVVRRIEARRRARIASAVPRFDRALDLGAEDGTLTRAWASKGRLTVMLDIDPAMLRGSTGVTADAGLLPLADASFDVVVLSAILEHVVDPVVTVRESARVLRPGGRIVGYVPWDRAVVRMKKWARRFGVGLGKLHGDIAPGHLRTFDRARLRRLFEPVATSMRISLDPLSFGYYIDATI